MVQGVGFRWFVQREAARMGLMGWTANSPDGSVEVVAEGPEAELERLVAELRQGPSGASVTQVDRASRALRREASSTSSSAAERIAATEVPVLP